MYIYVYIYTYIYICIYIYTVEPWIASNLVCECFTRRAKILKEF